MSLSSWNDTPAKQVILDFMAGVSDEYIETIIRQTL
jgi:hypothetical protein